MFVCSFCKKTIGPGISPLRVVITRPMTYKVVKEVELIGPVEDFVPGYETASERLACAPCVQEHYNQAPKPQVPEIPVNRTAMMTTAETYQTHARKCNGVIKIKNEDKEVIGEKPCGICERGKQFFSSLSPHLLNEVLEDTPALAVKIRLGTLIADSAYERSRMHSKRAQRDATEALKILRPYVEKVIQERIEA